MKQATKIVPRESANVDQDRLSALYLQLGQANAEDVVCRAMEELALRLSHCDRLYRDLALDDLRKGVRSLIAICRSNWNVRRVRGRGACQCLYR